MNGEDKAERCATQIKSGSSAESSVMILNYCFTDYARVGVAENFSQPVDYFWSGKPVKKVKKVSILGAPLPDDADKDVSMIVVGGGGIATLGRTNVWRPLKDIADKAPPTMPVIIWGMGINDQRIGGLNGTGQVETMSNVGSTRSVRMN